MIRAGPKTKSETHFTGQNWYRSSACGNFIFLLYRYHIIADVYTTALLRTKPSSDDDSGFGHGFGAKASLPLAQSAPAVSHDTTRLCQNLVAL